MWSIYSNWWTPNSGGTANVLSPNPKSNGRPHAKCDPTPNARVCDPSSKQVRLPPRYLLNYASFIILLPQSTSLDTFGCTAFLFPPLRSAGLGSTDPSDWAAIDTRHRGPGLCLIREEPSPPSGASTSVFAALGFRATGRISSEVRHPAVPGLWSNAARNAGRTFRRRSCAGRTFRPSLIGWRSLNYSVLPQITTKNLPKPDWVVDWKDTDGQYWESVHC